MLKKTSCSIYITVYYATFLKEISIFSLHTKQVCIYLSAIVDLHSGWCFILINVPLSLQKSYFSLRLLPEFLWIKDELYVVDNGGDVLQGRPLQCNRKRRGYKSAYTLRRPTGVRKFVSKWELDVVLSHWVLTQKS